MSSLRIGRHELIPFDISAKHTMETYLARLDLDNSDYTFAANYLWLSAGSGFYAVIDDCFCLFLLYGGELSMLLPPLGNKHQAISAMSTCFALMADNNHSPLNNKIFYVDEYLVADFVGNLEPGAEIFDLLDEFIVERSLVDYVYKTKSLIDLAGNAYSTKRNEINKFRRIHPSYQLEALDPEIHGAGITQLVNKWIAVRMKYIPPEQQEVFLDGVYSERLAIRRMLQDYRALNLIGLVIIIDGELKGFTAGEQINAQTASVIVEKTDFETFGCAQFIFREFAKVLLNEYNVATINVGDDMGFENLKKVKMSYRPSKLIPKYTIYQRH